MSCRLIRIAVVVSALLPGAAGAAHSGIAGDRTGPELSDIALAIFAAGAIWFVRRALRTRLPRGRSGTDRDG